MGYRALFQGGLALGSDSVPQLALRAGGINTVRGYDFGVEQGDAMWSTQLDMSKPGRSAVKLVGFLDAGQAGNRTDFGSAAFLSGAGVGVSILGGFMRADLSHPLTSAPGRGCASTSSSAAVAVRRVVVSLVVLVIVAVRRCVGDLAARSSSPAIWLRPARNSRYDGGASIQVHMTAPARLNWCPVTHVGVLEAISGDSGVSIVLYERESFTIGAAPDRRTGGRCRRIAPGCGRRLRWLRLDPDTALSGYRSKSGTGRCASLAVPASGDVQRPARVDVGRDTLMLRGVFRDVPVVTTAVGCS